MSEAERELNRYLFHEFGVEGDKDDVSESWPFKLSKLAILQAATIYEFEADQQYYAITGRTIDFMPKAGMKIGDLHKQMKGSEWISQRDPVGMDMSRPGDEAVPSSVLRRRVFDQMAAEAIRSPGVLLLEGLYLSAEARYIALIGQQDENEAKILGLAPTTLVVGFPMASSWRRLAWGVGDWLSENNRSGTAL